MIGSFKSIEEKFLPLPITTQARRIAQQNADQIPDAPTAQQVYLNTLAVLAINDYLQMMGIDTDLKASDSFNPVLRLAADVADLKVTGLGHLECRPVTPGESTCHIPIDVWNDRIGYAIAQIDEPARRATLLGFVPSVTTEELPISQLQPLEALLRHLHQLRQPATAETPTILSQWFENLFAAGWQTIETLFGSDSGNLAPNFRASSSVRDLTEGSVRAAKLIDLGIELGSQTVTLLVAIIPEADGQVGICVQLHPVPGETYLPPDLVLAVLSETGERLQLVRSRSLDNYIQLPRFQGHPSECFRIQIALDRVSLTEYFMI